MKDIPSVKPLILSNNTIVSKHCLRSQTSLLSGGHSQVSGEEMLSRDDCKEHAGSLLFKEGRLVLFIDCPLLLLA